MIRFLRFLPKNQLSSLVGSLARVRAFPSLQRLAIRAFVKVYQVDVTDLARPLEEFETLGEFFVRELRPGARPIGEGLVSPVDGQLMQHGAIREGRILQVKDRYQSVEMLLQDRELAAGYEGGYFITLYLAPADYHRVHSPSAGVITDVFVIPGKLWPVNTSSLMRIENLYGVNERVVVVMETDYGRLSLVMVGAMNVGSVRLTFDDIVTNQPGRIFTPRLGKERFAPEHRRYTPPRPIERGAHIGTFDLGSTVVLLFERGKFHPGRRCVVGRIRVGESLTR